MKNFTIIFLLSLSHSLCAESKLVLGPYGSQEEFKLATDFLTTNQIKFQTNNDAVMESLGFIVVTDPMSLSIADDLVNDLRIQGVLDLLYIRKGIYKGRVSAGIYSSNQGADKRAATLSAFGRKFRVMERQRTISSASITVVAGDLDPSVVNRLEAFTDLSVLNETFSAEKSEVSRKPNGKVPAGELKETPKVKETAEANQAPRFKEALVVNTDAARLHDARQIPEQVTGTTTPRTSSGVETKEDISSQKAAGKIVIQRQPQTESSFPLVLFLLIAISLLIVIGSIVFYRRQRTANNKVAHGQSARFEEVKEPPTLTATQEIRSSPERQLDGSVGAISAYANQILSGQNPGKDEVPQYLATIEMGGTEVLDLISDIIDLSRIEIGQIEVERISFDPESALQDLTKSLLPKAHDKGISLYFEAHENLPGLIASDPGKLEKILLPVLRHAIECTSSGQVSVTALFDETSELLEVTINHSADTLTAAQIEALFESSSSISEINNEKTLRFAVSKRFANLLGGSIEISHNSNQDVRYLITIQADEILKKQLLLPSGVSIDELVESESAAVQLAENAKAELNSAQTEARLAAIALTEAEKQTNTLTEKLEMAQSQAIDEKAARSKLESRSSETISQLNLDLEGIRTKLQTELDALTETESTANSRVTELETALNQASEELQTQSLARQAAEQSARDQVEELSVKLIDAEAQRDASTKELKISSTSKKEVEEIQTLLEEAKVHLASELESRSRDTDEYGSQIDVLKSQLAASKVVSDKETNNRLRLEESIQSLTQDWNDSRQSLEAQLTQSEQLAGDNHLQAEHLSAVLKKARHDTESQENKYKQLEQESQEELEVLELELGIARQQAIEDAKQAEESISQAGEELNSLRHQLSATETSLQADLTENDNQHGVEVTALQTALSHAEQNLDEATSIKVRVQESSGSQIEGLIDDVNQARAAARKEAEIRVEIEKETQGQINFMASELKDAKESLEAEARIRLELDRVSEFARETSQRLNQAEERVIQVLAEKDAAEQQVIASNEAIREMREEARRLLVSEDATRKKLQQQSKADPYTASRIVAPARSLVKSPGSMTHPVLRSMAKRFIERLDHQLQVMDSSIQRGKYLDLLVSVNWLKNDANNLGFSDFDTVISELELNLRQQTFEPIPDLVNRLKNIASGIELPKESTENTSSPGVSIQKDIELMKLVLPGNGRKAELQENFISQLGLKLMEMEAAWQEGDSSRLQKICNWIHRYSVKMKLDAITDPTEKLQSALKLEDHTQITQRMSDFFHLYSKIIIQR